MKDRILNFIQIDGPESHEMIFQIKVRHVVYINNRAKRDAPKTWSARADLDLGLVAGLRLDTAVLTAIFWDSDQQTRTRSTAKAGALMST